MADGSPLPFPSPAALLGEKALAADAVPEATPTDGGKKDKNHARRPGADKRKAPPRKAPTIEVKDAGGLKPKQTKSRNGCLTCKAKRLKCGEEKPGCQNCAKRNVTCGGYKKVFQWRDYGQQTVKLNLERPKQATTNSSPVRSPVRNASAGSSQNNTPVSEVPPRLSDFMSAPGTNSTVIPALGDGADVRGGLNLSTSLPRHDANRHDSALMSTPPDESQDPVDEFASVSFNPGTLFAYRSRSLSPGPIGGNTPTFTEFLIPHHVPDNDNSQDFVPFSMPEDMHFPRWSVLADDSHMDQSGFFDNHINDITIERQDAPIFPWLSNPGTLAKLKAPGLPASPQAMWDNMMSPIFKQIQFPAGSDEDLVRRYDADTCGILSVMDGPNENPWRTVVWSMAQHSAALYNALLAMAAFHASRDGPEYKLIGQEKKGLSIKNINEGIRENSMSDHTAIATALALGFTESWDRLTSTGNTHIKGAQALVKRALQQHRLRPLVGDELKRLKFLCNAWVFMDVISRLTSFDSDETTDFDSTYSFAPDSPRLSLARGIGSSRGFGIDFGMPVDARLDPLMGCAGTLFPIIGRVANLVRKVCRSNHNSPGIVSQARDLKLMLEDWDAPEEVEAPQDPTTGVQHTLQTAEAYRWATLLHLHQAVPELPSLPTDELAQRAMAAVATVPLESRTMIVQVYPLMVAGCAQTEEEDRQWVRERWQVMADRMKIGVLEKCMQVAEEVWRRKDAYEAKPVTHRKLVRTADLNEARRRSSPHPVKSTAGPGSEPGRIGMVYSYVETDCDPIAAQLKDVKGPDFVRRRREAADAITVDPAYSVRGPLHWIGVMWDWNWEVLLG